MVNLAAIYLKFFLSQMSLGCLENVEVGNSISVCLKKSHVCLKRQIIL